MSSRNKPWKRFQTLPMDLFRSDPIAQPLAARLRSTNLDEYVGQEHLLARGKPLREALEQGRQVKLSGFGNFDLRRKNPRPGRNPKTGEALTIAATTVPTFKAGAGFKAAVANKS